MTQLQKAALEVVLEFVAKSAPGLIAEKADYYLSAVRNEAQPPSSPEPPRMIDVIVNAPFEE
jgi:hypothetical protein